MSAEPVEWVLRGDDGRVVAGQCLVAATALSRARGLLGRKSLNPGEGLFLKPALSIHTFFMRFPIDAVFVGRDGVVVGVVAGLRPWRAATRFRARAVLELAAGDAARLDLRVGDRFEVATG